MAGEFWIFLGLLAVAFAIWSHARQLIADFKADPLRYEPPDRQD